MAIQNGILVSDINMSGQSGKVIVTREFVSYRSDEITNYVNLFNKFKQAQNIENDSFEDNTWSLKSEEDGYKGRTYLTFDFELNNYINNALKCYCLNLMLNRINRTSIKSELTTISKSLYKSNFFSLTAYEDFEDYIYSLSDSNFTITKDYIMKFISFLNNEDIPDEYKAFLQALESTEKVARILPDYRSILYFDYYIKRFLCEADTNKYYRYFPVILWWIITTIIPMRPIEFTRLKKNDCFEKDGKFYLKVQRAKPHSFIDKALGCRKKQTFRINKKIYDLIKSYTEHNLHKGEYILSDELLEKVKNPKSGKKVKYELIPDFKLRALVDDFYKKIIQKNYNKTPIDKKDIVKRKEIFTNKVGSNEIVKLQLGDTRHLAIINLVLQGANPLTIKEMAGHRDINSHIHYASHTEEFIESKTCVLMDTIRDEFVRLDKSRVPMFKATSRRNEKLNKIMVTKESSSEEFIEINNGICKRYKGCKELFPNLCLGECKTCNDFIEDLNSISNKDIEDTLKRIKKDIHEQLGIIKLYIQDANIKSILDKEECKFFFDSQANTETAANKLDNLIYQQAKYEVYKMKKSEIIIDEKIER